MGELCQLSPSSKYGKHCLYTCITIKLLPEKQQSRIGCGLNIHDSLSVHR